MSAQNTPGMILPKQVGMLAGNPRDSAIAQMKHSSSIQSQANKAMAGGKHIKKHSKHYKYKYHGGANGIVVPQFNMQYQTTEAPGTTPNDQISANLQTSTQSRAWAASDKLNGGKRTKHRKHRKGGNPNWVWGCYSGGKNKSSKRKHKTTKRKYKTTKRKHKTTKRKH